MQENTPEDADLKTNTIITDEDISNRVRIKTLEKCEKILENLEKLNNNNLIQRENWISAGFKIGVGLTLWGVILGIIGLLGWFVLAVAIFGVMEI